MSPDTNATGGNNRPTNLRHLPGTEPAPHHTTRPPPHPPQSQVRNPQPQVRNGTTRPRKAPTPRRIPWKAVARGASRAAVGAAIAECTIEAVIADEKVQRGKREQRDREIAAGHPLLLFPKKNQEAPPPAKPAPPSNGPPPAAPGKHWQPIFDPDTGKKEWLESDHEHPDWIGRRAPRK